MLMKRGDRDGLQDIHATFLLYSLHKNTFQTNVHNVVAANLFRVTTAVICCNSSIQISAYDEVYSYRDGGVFRPNISIINCYEMLINKSLHFRKCDAIYSTYYIQHDRSIAASITLGPI